MTHLAPEGSVALATQVSEGLPSWDLTDLYERPDSPRIEADLADADARGRDFAATYAGRLDRLSGAELAAAMEAFQTVDEKLGRVMSYAQLLFSADSTDPAAGQFYQGMMERCTSISAQLLFFRLELNRIDDTVLEAKLADPAFEHWRPYLRDLRVWRKHQLSDELERFVHEREVTGRAAWSRLFDETVAGMRIPFGGENLTVNAVLNKLSDPDRRLREVAAEAIGQAFTDRRKLFSLITNTLAKDKEIIDTWRRFPRPSSDRNLSNVVEDEVVDALVSAVVADFPRLSHRYYRLKAKWLGLEKLQHWDRNAPLPGDDDRRVTWSEAEQIVLGAYDRFDPDLGAIGRRFFDRGWIDAALREGKAGGAFAHPTVPSVHPYILMNFHGRTRDVMTLAHELGHGVHQVLAGEQGYLLSGTPLTLAETASVFGEMLTFRALLDAETDPKRKRLMLAGKVEDMLNTVVRQIAFYRFETLLHDERRTGELLPERIGEIWLRVQAESLGPAFEFSPEYAVFWAYIPHFIHSPFYVYAYAFGDCLVNALYAVFQSGHPGFQAKYRDMLRAGGTKVHRDLLAPFGLDASDPAFWRRGLDVIAGFIDELEAGDV
jgi:oligoendopeptidase F